MRDMGGVYMQRNEETWTSMDDEDSMESEAQAWGGDIAFSHRKCWWFGRVSSSRSGKRWQDVGCVLEVSF